MALALALTPLYDRVGQSGFSFRFHVGPLPTTWLEVALVIAVAVGLVAGWDQLPWRNPYTAPALLLLAGASLGAIFTPNHREALGLWKAYFIEPMLAGVVIAWLARERRTARLLLLGLAFAGGVAAVVNLYAVGVGLAEHRDIAHLPPVLLYRTANAVALFLVPLDAFALAILLHSDDRRERWAATIFLALTGAAVLLSLSRAGLGVLVLVAVLAALFARRRVLVLGAIGVAGLAALALPFIRRRILVELDLGSPDNTITLRLALWRSALNMLSHRPLTGGGLSGFKSSLRPYQVPAYAEDQIYPHNLFLNFWTETGLVGLAGFLWVAVQLLRTGMAGLRSGPWARVMSIGLLGMLLAVFLHGQFDVPYFKNDLSVEFWALAGLQLGALRAASNDNQP
jgi:O-antigen ligase